MTTNNTETKTVCVDEKLKSMVFCLEKRSSFVLFTCALVLLQSKEEFFANFRSRVHILKSQRKLRNFFELFTTYDGTIYELQRLLDEKHIDKTTVFNINGQLTLENQILNAAKNGRLDMAVAIRELFMDKQLFQTYMHEDLLKLAKATERKDIVKKIESWPTVINPYTSVYKLEM